MGYMIASGHERIVESSESVYGNKRIKNNNKKKTSKQQPKEKLSDGMGRFGSKYIFFCSDDNVSRFTVFIFLFLSQ